MTLCGSRAVVPIALAARGRSCPDASGHVKQSDIFRAFGDNFGISVAVSEREYLIVTFHFGPREMIPTAMQLRSIVERG